MVKNLLSFTCDMLLSVLDLSLLLPHLSDTKGRMVVDHLLLVAIALNTIEYRVTIKAIGYLFYQSGYEKNLHIHLWLLHIV